MPPLPGCTQASLARSGTPDPTAACAPGPGPPSCTSLGCVLPRAQMGRAGHRAAAVSCRKVYEFLSTFIVTGMRYLLSQQVRPRAG